jgi:hypothetical protein
MYGQPWTTYAPQMYPNVGGAQVAPQGFFGKGVTLILTLDSLSAFAEGNNFLR